LHKSAVLCNGERQRCTGVQSGALGGLNGAVYGSKPLGAFAL